MSRVCHQRVRLLSIQVCKGSNQLLLQTSSFYFPFYSKKRLAGRCWHSFFPEDLGIYSTVVSKERSKFPQLLIQEENSSVGPLVVLEFFSYFKSYSCEVSSFQHLVFWMLKVKTFYFEIKQILIFSL